jgi:hypothetical protein
LATGLERLTEQVLNLPNVRQAVLYPRDRYKSRRKGHEARKPVLVKSQHYWLGTACEWIVGNPEVIKMQPFSWGERRANKSNFTTTPSARWQFVWLNRKCKLSFVKASCGIEPFWNQED